MGSLLPKQVSPALDPGMVRERLGGTRPNEGGWGGRSQLKVREADQGMIWPQGRKRKCSVVSSEHVAAFIKASVLPGDGRAGHLLGTAGEHIMQAVAPPSLPQGEPS